MDFSALEKELSQEPAFRLKQAKKAVFRDLIEDWRKLTVFSALLREKLAAACPLSIKAEIFESADQETIKALIELEDSLKVETVLMRHGGRNTVCVSSMVGCPLACEFCATGKMGFKRHLTAGEIAEQVLFFARLLNQNRQRVNNVVFMGMGEPLLNYDNVLAASRLFNDKDGINIGARHISISTVGIVPGLEKLAQEKLQINLAISLHFPSDAQRSEFMPVNKKYSLAEVLAAVGQYLEKTKRKVMFEYIMIKDVNDGSRQARELTRILQRFRKGLFMVNLISYNPTGIFKPSAAEKIKDFRRILENQGIETTQRYRFGRGIKAACGQLVS